MTLFGVRPAVWLAVAASTVAAGLGLGEGATSPEGGTPSGARAGPTSARPDQLARDETGRGTRIRVGALELARDSARGIVFEGPATNGSAGPARRGGAGGAGRGASPAASAQREGMERSEALRPWTGSPRPRSGEVVSLERDALRALSALSREDADALAADVEARIAALEPEPSEPPRAFEERREDARGRLVSDELLLRARLSELYAQQTYPLDFDFEHTERMERQLIEQLPAVDRAEALRRLAEAGPPGRPQPRFEGTEGIDDDGGGSDL